MEKFIIQGGNKLHGSVRLGGAKNASFKLMIAALFADGESRLLNIPQISDVEITRRIIEHLGGTAKMAGDRLLCISGGSIKSPVIPQEFGERSRAASMFIAPLLVRFGRAIVPLPGGDRIGIRPLDRHVAVLKALGAQVTMNSETANIKTSQLTGARFRFDKITHTGTETAIMAAVCAKGKTVLENTSLEPEVDDLIEMLVKMGATLKRRSGRTIEVVGTHSLNPTIHRVMADRNEAVSYACAALATGGDIIVENAPPEHLEAFLVKLSKAGGSYEVGRYGIRFFASGKLSAVDVTTRPHPGFMTDWQPLWAVLMTQAKGKSVIHETVHTNRFGYVADLQRMGAQITLFNPTVTTPQRLYQFNLADDRPEYRHAARIEGPTTLVGLNLRVHDIRAGATLVLAALIARGKSIITGVSHIDRGYENLDGRLIDLGASLRRV